MWLPRGTGTGTATGTATGTGYGNETEAGRPELERSELSSKLDLVPVLIGSTFAIATSSWEETFGLTQSRKTWPGIQYSRIRHQLVAGPNMEDG